MGLLGVVVSDLEVLLGVNCSPTSILEILSGQTCTAHPVCCENNAKVSPVLLTFLCLLTGLQDTLISIGCIPIVL